MNQNDSSQAPKPEHDHGGMGEQQAREEGEHGWGYGGRTAEEANRPTPEEKADAEQRRETEQGKNRDQPLEGKG
jgi:hypothetical protein